MEKLQVRYLDKKGFEATIRKHHLLVDLPLGHGGKDQGPNPPELFVLSLASCIGMYLVFYCTKAGLDPTGLEIEAEYQKGEDKIESITIRFSLPAAKTEKERTEALQWADRCLIHNTIRYQPKIEVMIA